MLPISWPVSVVLAVILSVIHLGCRIASSVHDYLFLQTVRVPLLPLTLADAIVDFINKFVQFQLIAEVFFLATASVSGLYYRIMSDAAHNRTVDGTRTGIQQRVKLECEREQQEQLLLSVIPAYIAAEVYAVVEKWTNPSMTSHISSHK